MAALLGGGPGEVEAYGSADVAARLHAGERPGCPLVVLHGTEDRQVPVGTRSGCWARTSGSCPASSTTG